MADFIRKSNNPSTAIGSIGGVFSCCFSKPKTSSSPLNSYRSNIHDDIVPPTITVTSEGSGEDSSDGDDNLYPYKSTNKDGNVPDRGKITSMSKDIVSDAIMKESPSNNSTTYPSHLSQTPSVRAASTYDSHTIQDSQKKDDRPLSTSTYATWNDTYTESNENIPQSVIAGGSTKGSITGEREYTGITGGNVPGSVHSAKSDSAQSVETEFAEEPYTKNSDWRNNMNSTLESDSSLNKTPTVSTKIFYDLKTGILSCTFGQVTKAPKKDVGGAMAYQIRTAIMLPKKIRWHSKIYPAPNPNINEVAIFKNIAPDELAKSAMRIRVYGCDMLRRHHVFAETLVAFSSLNIRQEATYQLALELRKLRTDSTNSDTDSSDDEHSKLTNHSKGSRLSLHRGSLWSEKSSILPTTAQLEVAKSVAKTKDDTWPELSIGLSYKSQTGRLNVNILKASKLKIPGSPDDIPKSYVNIALMTKLGEKIDVVKTSTASPSRSPEFNQPFAFNVGAGKINDLNLYFRVYNKHKVHKPDNLGWFAMGSTSTGQEENAHWTEMLEASGKEIIRWHALNENIA